MGNYENLLGFEVKARPLNTGRRTTARMSTSGRRRRPCDPILVEERIQQDMSFLTPTLQTGATNILTASGAVQNSECIGTMGSTCPTRNADADKTLTLGGNI